MSLLVQKLMPNAKIPTRGSQCSIGYDLYSNGKTYIPPYEQALVGTGIAITVPAGTYGRIAPRSGLALKNNIHVNAGVIDPDYTGEVRVLLYNSGDATFEIKEGDRVAQLILEQAMIAPVVEVNTIQATERGAGGFGSTGK